VGRLDEPRPDLHTDIPRLRAGGVGGQFWSVYVASTLAVPEAVVSTLEQIDAVHRLVARYPETLALAWSADDVERAIAAGRIASLLGVEGGHSLAGSLGVLRSLVRLGVRYVTLTHNDNVAWADSATDAEAVGGLTDDGRAIVAELNRLGVLVDLSHTSAATQRAALAVTRAPVIFSHSSAHAVHAHPRNVDDEVLGLVRANGGVVQVTFVPRFVSAEVHAWTEELAEVRRAASDGGPQWSWPAAPRPSEVAAAEAAAAAADHTDRTRLIAGGTPPVVQAWLDAHPRPRVGLETVADHVEHVRDVAGVDHVGLGGDYDGVDWQPEGLEDVSGYPRLLAVLAERGWSRNDLEALTGRNVLRVLRDAEDVAEDRLFVAPRINAPQGGQA
jgi:membrane dipeptidase